MKLDHLAVSGEMIGCATELVEDALGVKMQPGGQHPVFGTYNNLLGLEDGLYLEAIAIDPEAPRPDRPRWFDLDRFCGPARLTNWICATEDLDAILAQMPETAGRPIELSRGELCWRMAVPVDGVLPYDNMFPPLIEWSKGQHPSDALTPSGCALKMLVVSHPKADSLRRTLAPHLDDDRVQFETGDAGLMAEFSTPHEKRKLFRCGCKLCLTARLC